MLCSKIYFRISSSIIISVMAGCFLRVFRLSCLALAGTDYFRKSRRLRRLIDSPSVHTGYFNFPAVTGHKFPFCISRIIFLCKIGYVFAYHGFIQKRLAAFIQRYPGMDRAAVQNFPAAAESIGNHRSHIAVHLISGIYQRLGRFLTCRMHIAAGRLQRKLLLKR